MLTELRRFIRRLQASEKFDLPYILGQADPARPLPERVEWLASLVEWIRDGGRGASAPAARVRFVLQLLERNPEWKRASAETIRSVLRETRHLRLYTEVGLPTKSTFGREFRGRLLNVIIPEYLDPSDLAGVQTKIFYDDDDPDWAQTLPEETLTEIVSWLRTGLSDKEDLVPGWMDEVLEASRSLAARSLEITLRDDFRRRAPETSFHANPFARLGRRLDAFAEHGGDPGLFDEMRGDLADARRLLSTVRSHLEQTGISVDLVYQIDRIRNDLARLARLITILEREESGENIRAILFSLWIDLLRGHARDGDFAAVFRKHIGLLSKKIVERTGDTGEHYITQNAAEYRAMLVTAAGGGALTAITAFLKYTPLAHSGPLFFEFLFGAVNYSVSFLIMHFAGFKLATKQPSMTAAALAGKLKEDGGQSDDEAFVDEIARIARSQFAAVAGNLCAVIPAAWLVDTIYHWQVGHHFFDAEQARGFLDSINPAISGTLFFGCLTGIALWLSSMIAGWVENASVYARIPDLIRTHPGLRWILGEKRTQRWADAYLHNISGIVGSIALGVFLAAPPIVGRFFGIPLAVPHVTLSTGATTYSFLALGAENLILPLVLFSVLGIACIGLLNFGVSFALALLIAVRARDLQGSRIHSLFRLALRRMVRHPLEFLLPMASRRSAGEISN